MKTKTNAVCAIAALFSLAADAGAGDAFGLAAARARELCAKMTLEEKAGELVFVP